MRRTRLQLTCCHAASPAGQHIRLGVLQGLEYERPRHVSMPLQGHAQRLGRRRPQQREPARNGSTARSGNVPRSARRVELANPERKQSCAAHGADLLTYVPLLSRLASGWRTMCLLSPVGPSLTRGSWRAHLMCSAPSRQRTSGPMRTGGTRPYSSALRMRPTAVAATRPLSRPGACGCERCSFRCQGLNIFLGDIHMQCCSGHFHACLEHRIPRIPRTLHHSWPSNVGLFLRRHSLLRTTCLFTTAIPTATYICGRESAGWGCCA